MSEQSSLPPSDPGLALCLSSSFFGYYAHLGLLSAMEAKGIRPGRISGASAGALAGGLFAKMKNTGAALGSFNPVARASAPAETTGSTPGPTIVDLPPPPTPSTDAVALQTETEGDWAGTDIASATDAISNFSIGDEEDDDML